MTSNSIGFERETVKIKRNKKHYLAIPIITILLLCFFIYLSYTPNFMFPPKDMKRYSDFFIYEDSCVYAFSNKKNDTFGYLVGDSILCWVNRFNEYTELPKLIDWQEYKIYENSLENSYGKDPMITTYDKQGKYHKNGHSVWLENKEVSFRHKSNFSSQIIFQNNNCLAIHNHFSDIFIANKEGLVEKCFSFDTPTNCTFIFLKRDDNFYIIYYYGIRGHEITRHSKILNPEIVNIDWEIKE